MRSRRWPLLWWHRSHKSVPCRNPCATGGCRSRTRLRTFCWPKRRRRGNCSSRSSRSILHPPWNQSSSSSQQRRRQRRVNGGKRRPSRHSSSQCSQCSQCRRCSRCNRARDRAGGANLPANGGPTRTPTCSRPIADLRCLRLRRKSTTSRAEWKAAQQGAAGPRQWRRGQQLLRQRQYPQPPRRKQSFPRSRTLLVR